MRYLAISNGLDMIPVINKIDLPSADVVRTQEMIESAVGLDATDAHPGERQDRPGRSEEVLEAIVHRLPPPTGDPEAPLQALIFDSWFDSYRGVVVLARVINGRLAKGAKIRLMSNGQGLRCGVDGRADAEAGRDRRAGRRRGWVSSPPRSRMSRTPRSATPSPKMSGPARQPLARIRRTQADGLRRNLYRRFA